MSKGKSKGKGKGKSMSMSKSKSASQPACPVCGRPLPGAASETVFPFCSSRCKLIDLGCWLDGRYAVASKAPFDEGDMASKAPFDEGDDGHEVGVLDADGEAKR